MRGENDEPGADRNDVSKATIPEIRQMTDERLDDKTERAIDQYRKACQLTPHTDMDVTLKELRSRVRELHDRGVQFGVYDFADYIASLPIAPLQKMRDVADEYFNDVAACGADLDVWLTHPVTITATLPAKSRTEIKMETVMAGGTLDDAEKIISGSPMSVSADRAEKDERAWVIEYRGEGTPPPSYWAGGGKFTLLHQDAIRFAREVDADRVLHSTDPMLGSTKCVAAEHMWCDRSLPAADRPVENSELPKNE